MPSWCATSRPRATGPSWPAPTRPRCWPPPRMTCASPPTPPACSRQASKPRWPKPLRAAARPRPCRPSAWPASWKPASWPSTACSKACSTWPSSTPAPRRWPPQRCPSVHCWSPWPARWPPPPRSATSGCACAPDPELWVNAPPDALQRIVLNLTSNAIKFTSGSAVLLFARLQAGQVRIGVVDTGPGISEANQQRLFDAFVRLPQDREQAGLGLGLAIVKRLAAQMGARRGTEVRRRPRQPLQRRPSLRARQRTPHRACRRQQAMHRPVRRHRLAGPGARRRLRWRWPPPRRPWSELGLPSAGVWQR